MQKLTLGQYLEYLAQDMYIPEEDNLRESTEQFLKDKMKGQDLVALIERKGLKLFNMEVKVFRIQDIIQNRAINSTRNE